MALRIASALFTASFLLLALPACDRTDDRRAIGVAEDRRDAASPDLARAASSSDPGIRARAALAYGRIQHRDSARTLALLSADSSKPVRLAALFALGQLGLAEGAIPGEEAWSAALLASEDPDPDVVAHAAEALGKLAVPASIDRLLDLARHDSAAVRREAVTGLFRCRFAPVWRKEADEPPLLPGPAVQALIDACADPDAGVRQAAAHAFSRYGDRDAVPALLALLDDPDEWTRVFALRAIGRSGKPSAAEPIVRALDDPSAHVRMEAVTALAALGSIDSVPQALASDPSFHVRAAFARGLAGTLAPGSLGTLARLEADESSTVRAAAIDALARRSGAAYEPSLRRHLESESWPIRVAAARAVSALEGAGRTLAAELARDPDPRVRAAAIEGLELLGGGEDLLRDALADADLAVRGTAVGVLAAWDAVDPADRSTLLGDAYNHSAGEEWIEVREAIVDALAADAQATDALQRIASEDPAPSVRSRARVALRELGLEVAAEPVELPEPSPFLDADLPADPIVVLETSKGTIRIRCLAAEAPLHVASFLDLVRRGHYDGLPWHRVVPNFVIQGGDPRGDGWGGAGYTLRDEIHPGRYERGTLGMPKAGKDTGGGQVFLTHVPTPHLDGNYTVFGRVVEGLDVVDRIEVGDTILRARVS